MEKLVRISRGLDLGAGEKAGRKTAKPMFFAILFLAMALMASVSSAATTTAMERVPVIMLGDRLVDVSYHLGVVPHAMSVRCSGWPLSQELKIVADTLGCPTKTLANTSGLVETAKKYGITHVMAEYRATGCSAKSKLRMEKLSEKLKGEGLKIDYVDFSEGPEKAVTQTAEALGLQDRAQPVIDKYKADKEKTDKLMPESPLGTNILVLNGVYSEQTGKTFLRVEAPGGYTDVFLLDPLGCKNVGDKMFSETAKTSKGFYTLRKLSKLDKANPDVIIITGDNYSCQKAIESAVKKNPALQSVPAVQNLAIYSLPAYMNSSALDYPLVLRKWAKALN